MHRNVNLRASLHLKMIRTIFYVMYALLKIQNIHILKQKCIYVTSKLQE